MSSEICHYCAEEIFAQFENVVDSLGWDSLGGKENNDLYEWYIWLKELVE